MKRGLRNKKRLFQLAWPYVVLICLALIILRERIGIRLNEEEVNQIKDYGEKLYEVADEAFSEGVLAKTECLVIVDSTDEQSNAMWKQMSVVLDDMRIASDVVNLANEEMPDLKPYEKMVITTGNLSSVGQNIVNICDWIKEGGCLMNTGTFQVDPYFQVLGIKAGITNVSEAMYTQVSGMRMTSDVLINAKERVFMYDEPTLTALDVSLLSKCDVHIEDAETKLPLLWEVDYGEGEIVFSNQVLTGKVSRGILCAAYSLLGDSCVYPVINGSAFYIDDFPSPVPSGNGTYISEEYGVGISSFYSNIWWPDMLELREKYDLVHTGLIIVDYSDQVEGVFEKNENTERFVFFGNMLLNEGGELGFHGYNHMPLCLDNYDYRGLFDAYEKWKSIEDMEHSITITEEFSKELFPESRFSVYVPPSNILSNGGREALKNSWKDLRVIASTYNEDEVAYSQEFEVAQDGLVETPRITSGCIFDEYMMLAAFSELNFHYVQSHFIHPDDVLDEDRGALLGWETMRSNLEQYMDYIYTAAPQLRNLSGSGMGQAVREFDEVSIQKTETEDKIYISLGGFYDEVYLMLRVEEGVPEIVTGGSMENVAQDLYLIHATEDKVVVDKN